MGTTQSDPARTWFDVLRAAKASGDRQLEGMARRELEQMGIRVSIRQQPAPEGRSDG
jgi:hypothetical protein